MPIKIPPKFESSFKKTQEKLSKILKEEKKPFLSHTYNIAGERYLLIRASASNSRLMNKMRERLGI